MNMWPKISRSRKGSWRSITGQSDDKRSHSNVQRSQRGDQRKTMCGVCQVHLHMHVHLCLWVGKKESSIVLHLLKYFFTINILRNWRLFLRVISPTPPRLRTTYSLHLWFSKGVRSSICNVNFIWSQFGVEQACYFSHLLLKWVISFTCLHGETKSFQSCCSPSSPQDTWLFNPSRKVLKLWSIASLRTEHLIMA
jgi:hypothetical protein